MSWSTTNGFTGYGKRKGSRLPGSARRNAPMDPKARLSNGRPILATFGRTDFVEDRTVKGSKIRILSVLDEFTRENLALRVERSIPSWKVIETLKWLFLMHGAPEHIRSDNGPEFIAKAIQDWIAESGSQTIYITPGSPWENPFIESFNGKFRDECLNMEIFANLKEAQVVIVDWRSVWCHSCVSKENTSIYSVTV